MTERTFERAGTKGIALIVSATLLSLAFAFGLVQVGRGVASRGAEGITITGSAKTTATADKAVWVLSAQESARTQREAVQKVEASIRALSKYLTDGGVPSASITLGPVSTFANEEYVNGSPTGQTLSYRAERNLTARSKDVQLVSSLSNGIGSLLTSGVNIQNYGPQYYISDLPSLRPKLLAEAMKDAKVRAQSIVKVTGGSVGPVLSVRSGPFQVTTPDSTDTSAGGFYDTSTIEKTVTSTVTVVFKVR